MKEKIRELIKISGFSDSGFADARIYSELSEIRDVPFAPASGDERINPFLIMEDAKTIIVLLASYNTDAFGNLSSYAMGKDYHMVLKKYSEPVIEFIENKGFSARFFCDNAPLDERFLAYLAGLGFIGKNGFLISPKFGSRVFLAHIVTNMQIPADKPLELGCLNCGKCVSACPTKALKMGDFYRCLSYITQKKGELSEEEADLIRKGGSCWGCDICQSVCPHNSDAPLATIPEFSKNLITKLEIPEMSNREFKEKFGDRAFSWRGKSILMRNLAILDKQDKQ